MTSRILETQDDVDGFVKLIHARGLPCTVTVKKGRDRSHAQNELAFKWYQEIARDLGDQTTEEVRALCKLTIGVPIMRGNDKFKAAYDRLVKPLAYEDKLEAIRMMDIPITRLMTTRQMTEYLDTVQRTFTQQGCVLTDPDALKRGEA